MRKRKLSRIDRNKRSGLAIIMVIAFFAIAVAMIGVWVRSSLDTRQRVRRWHEKTQAVWLADAGVRRAMARIALDSEYRGEVWSIPAEEIGGKWPADVVIRVEPASKRTAKNDSATKRVEITATAKYPAGLDKRVQHTSSTLFRLKMSDDKIGESS